METIFTRSLVFLALAVVACGPTLQRPAVTPELFEREAHLQREMLFKTLIDRRARLQHIYTPLRIANADLCGAYIAPVTGMVGIDRQSIPPELRETAQQLYGVADGVTLVDVVPGSPSDAAGLKARDVITGAAKGVGVMPSGWTWSGLTVQDLAKVILTSGSDPITMLVRRGGTVSPVVINPQLGCSYPIELASDDSFNAFADGSRIVVFTGLFNHVPDDREVAVIVGHELAHNVLRHLEKRRGNVAAGGVVGLLADIGLATLGVNTQGAISRAGMEAGAKAYSQDFEFEADYLGLYMLARAGFNIDVAPDFYRRMGVQLPESQIKTYAATHPSTPERAVAMAQTILEIREKLSRHEALLPKMLPGEVLTVNPHVKPASGTLEAKSPESSQTLTSGGAAALTAAPSVGPPGLPSQASTLAPSTTQTAPTALQPVPATPSTPSGGGRMLAQLYLIRGPIVSTPPQAFNAEYLDTGKASVVLSGRRRLTGDFELFDMDESISAKYTARLIKPDVVKPAAGANVKAFAVFSDDIGTEMECSYSFNKTSRRGQGICVDNQNNTYQIVFD
jgi:beta-barrel assembly-enhancing protease